MNVALFYDTETSGLPLFREPSEHPGQPHIVQLAALLVDLDTRKTIASMDVIVRPDGWMIDDEAAALHGITAEHAADVGVPESLAVEMLMSMWGQRLRIGHNETFDARILRIAQHRFPLVYPEPKLIAWKEGAAECTARLSRPVCALPKSKMPTMGEAYRHFTGKELENAHNAMADTQACMAVYFAILGAAKVEAS